MPTIEITDDDDKRLRELAPPYLQGDRKHSGRVAWLIGEFIRIRNGSANSEPAGGEPRTEGST